MTTEIINSYMENAPMSVELVAECLIYAENELTSLYSAVSQLFGHEQAQLTAEDWLSELENDGVGSGVSSAELAATNAGGGVAPGG
jgi:hypothetical protein